MRYPLILALFLFLCNDLSAQKKTVDQYIRDGITFHDQGKYDKALASYKKALSMDGDNTTVLYEMALTNFHKGDYKKALNYCNKVLKLGSDDDKSAYIIKGSALDMMGKTDSSIELFKEAIASYPNEYLLHFNLAVNYYKLGRYKECEDALYGSIAAKEYHPGSHLLMMNVHKNQSNNIRAMLSAYYFLMLEPDTPRAKEAYDFLSDQLKLNEVEQTGENEFSINLDMGAIKIGEEDEFSTVRSAMAMKDLMVGGSKILAESEDAENEGEAKEAEIKDDFYAVTEYFFTMLGDEEPNDNIWHNLYIPYFKALQDAGHTEAFSHFIRQGHEKESLQWLEDNKEKTNALIDWAVEQ